MWIKHTAQNRLKLPLERIESTAGLLYGDYKPSLPIPILLEAPRGLQSVVGKTQELIDEEINHWNCSKDLPVHLRVQIIPGTTERNPEFASCGYKVKLLPFIALPRQETFSIDGLSNVVTLHLSDLLTARSLVSDFTARVVFHEILHDELAQLAVSPVYPSRAHITFALLYEEADLLAWDVESVLSSRFTALRRQLKGVVDMEVETQVHSLVGFPVEPVWDGEAGEYVVESGDVQSFAHSLEQSIGAAGRVGDTVYLKFVLYIPGRRHSPLSFGLDSSVNSFVVPNWGSVAVLNFNFGTGTEQFDGPLLLKIPEEFLAPYIDLFAGHLFGLLGLSQNDLWTPVMRIAAFKRVATVSHLRHAMEALQVTAKLSVAQRGTPVAETDVAQVEEALSLLDSALSHMEDLNERISTGNLTNVCVVSDQIAASAVKAHRLSLKALSSASMLQQTNDPMEHTIAIYLPLLGPVVLSLLLATMKAILERI